MSSVFDCQWLCRPRLLSSATWSMAPPNSLRYQTLKQPLLSYPLHHESQQRLKCYEEDWEESLGVCVLVQHDESNDMRTLLQLSVFNDIKPGELKTTGIQKLLDFPFPLTTINGSQQDDISFERLQKNRADAAKRKDDCFRSLFEAEGCPAPFVHGSRFYCFHCPGTVEAPVGLLKPSHDSGLKRKSAELLPLLSLPQCSRADGGEERLHEGESEEEEKLAIMYERLRVELPRLFAKNHDFGMYSTDLEFINGLTNSRSRGLVAYRLTLTLWRLLCLCYYAHVRLEVLKLTKHTEDGSIKARWRVRGLPLYTLLLFFFRRDKSQLYRSYDAFSTFYIGHDGLIRCHKVEKVMPAQPPLLPRGTTLLKGALVALGVEEHRPALNLLPFFLSSLRHKRN
ncbi:uncharacterized protein C6orf136 homolog [Nematolebias whitei]|uniref:uncharacterized protein C6orf136 homolog n=1 Tax=Nematolebias whitei TaxID=451745 RepID=UPI00189A4052|nr:uncharacterized protein C6orf136 homolog [Nematolebias whitei]